MMSKQTAIILILVVFLGALGALIYFYFSFNAFKPTVITPVQIDTGVYDPFGTITSNTPVPATDAPIIDAIPQVVSINKLRQISTDPISGFSVIEDTKNQRTNVHYILRANGNIYEVYTNSLEVKRLSVTTIPKVYESVWLPNGTNLIIRYLQDITNNIQTFSVKINPATTTLNEFEGGVDGNHLTENIATLSINPAGDKIFYLTNSLNGATGYISKPDGLNKKVLFESPLIEWTVSWPKESTITFTTKPSAGVLGFLYFLNSQTGSFSRILGNINGLTTKTNDASTEVLYSDSIRNTPRIYLYNIKNGEGKLLPWNTLPEKCLWSNTDDKIVYCAVPNTFPMGDYPDAWYQGLVNFSDSIWSINTDTMSATLVYDINKESNNKIDAMNLQLDKNDNYLFFMNKTDLSFWSLKLK